MVLAIGVAQRVDLRKLGETIVKVAAHRRADPDQFSGLAVERCRLRQYREKLCQSRACFIAGNVNSSSS